MDRRRLQGQMAGTARTGKHEVEVVAEMAFEVDGGTTRIRVGPAGAPERSEVREVQDPAVARWVEKFHFDVERMARAEAHRRRPCVPNWKPPRTTTTCARHHGVPRLRRGGGVRRSRLRRMRRAGLATGIARISRVYRCECYPTVGRLRVHARSLALSRADVITIDGRRGYRRNNVWSTCLAKRLRNAGPIPGGEP